jgi:hypothetical protein
MLEPPRPYEAQALQRPKKVQELLASGDLNEALTERRAWPRERSTG